MTHTWPSVSIAAFLFGALLTTSATSRTEATSFGASDLIDSPIIELQQAPLTAARTMQEPQDNISGNPLWSIPLSVLTATRSRPLFSPSRRPVPPTLQTSQPVAIMKPPPLPAEPPAEELPLNLIGTIGNGSDSIAIFTEQRTKNVVRLRVGEAYSGWVLRSVQAREALLEGASRTETVIMSKQY